MRWFEPIGYVGSFLMFLTFFMKTMIPLRITAIAANCVMIIYTASAGIMPVLILQSCLLPLNILRFVQMKRLVARVKQSAQGKLDLTPLLPFMRKQMRQTGDILFKAGEQGDRMYYLQKGEIRLRELDIVLGAGEVMGEISLLSADRARTATAVCESACELYEIDQEVVMQLFYQRPEFGFFLVRLVTKRLLDNIDNAEPRAALVTRA
jgi:CRP/FNR family transcriptional regulator, cyclic AMP receptor protein